jgi:TonB family protein
VKKAKKAAPAKVVENKVTELPAKENAPEELSPEISDEQSVVVAPATAAVQSEEKLELIPVKEKLAGVEAAEGQKEEDGDAMEEVTEPTKEESPSAIPAGASGESADAKTNLAQGGASKAGAVSYLDLKQTAGNKAPQYPLQARKDGRQGQVELLYRVTKEGTVTDLQVTKSSGHKDLDQEAVRAVSQFKFVPGQEGWARHPVAFTLKGDTATLPSRLRANSAQAE